MSKKRKKPSRAPTKKPISVVFEIGDDRTLIERTVMHYSQHGARKEILRRAREPGRIRFVDDI